jgi:hypothetical protein
VRASAAPLRSRRRLLLAFLAAELILVMAIPFLLIHGYHTLLDSRAGNLIAEPGPDDPGWLALVDPSEVVGIAEVERGAVTGVTLLIHNPLDGSTGGAVLVPGTLELDGRLLQELPPADAVAAVSAALRLGANRTEVLDEDGWRELLGATSYSLPNPDPVSPLADGPGFAVGTVEVDGSLAAAFVGRAADGAGPVSALPRRRLLWEALLSSPPSGQGPLADDLAAIDSASSRVLDMPVLELEPRAVLDADEAEQLIRDIVAFPAGAVLGDRLGVRVVDRTGEADLGTAAATVAAVGVEVVSIGNAGAFAPGPTELVVPPGLLDDPLLAAAVEELQAALGIPEATVDDAATEEGGEDRPLATVIVGTDRTWLRSS